MTAPSFLTPAAKARELSSWAELKRGPRGRGGLGYPDDRVFPLVDALNALPGVCTLQSCAGHSSAEIGESCSYPGNVWLWLSADVFERFIACAHELALARGIESVNVLFGRYADGRPVVDVTFWGDDRPGELAQSSARIVTFFRRLAHELTP